jgi:acyl-CoA thioesterase I
MRRPFVQTDTMSSLSARMLRICQIALVATLGTLVSGRALAVPIKVACVGDSITQNSGWSDKLGVLLGANYTSTNYGVSGTTLLKKGDVTYWTTGAFTQSHSSNPDIVVIMLGTNDSKPQNWNTHKGEFVGDYEALIDSYAALPSHPKIYVTLCPPAGTNGYGISGTVIENEVLPDLEQIAVAKGLPTIDVFTAFGGHNLDQSLYGSPADLVHPNAKGAQRIADTVYAALKAAPSDGGTDGAIGDARADAGSSTGDAKAEAPGGSAGAGGGAGTPAGTGGAGGSTGTAGSAAGTGGSTGTAGGAGGSTGPAGGAGGAGGSSVTGAAGTTGSGGADAKPARPGSSGCAVSGRGADSSALGLALGLVALVFARRRRAL